MSITRQDIGHVREAFVQCLNQANDQAALEKCRVAFLGRNGQISALMHQLKTLSAQEKRELGPTLNQLKQETTDLLARKTQKIEKTHKKLSQQRLQNFDVTSYLPQQAQGSLHPYTQMIEHMENVFTSMGFAIADGPEVETDYYNFEALNIPADHPARDIQDTLWLSNPAKLLRTHTSTVQIHAMEQQEPPIAIVAPGRCYRNEATDATHDFMFMQVEGLLIDKNISLAHLFATMQTCLRAIFGSDNLKIRVRPGYFPFVEPGVEIDVSCPFCSRGCSICKHTRWIETTGAGLVHPNVLRASGIDQETYTGFAFGMGLSRLVMIKHGIDDIRLLHGGTIDFLAQF